VNRELKDRVFQLLFSEKEELLVLYNAINGTNYQNPEEMQITTLDDAIFLGMKNDCSFIIGDYLNLYEHQSTWSPNLPLRCSLYLSEVYKGQLEGKKIYSQKLIQLPTPICIIFYNGSREIGEEEIQFLSSALADPSNPSCLELKVRILNINVGHNRELMNKCRLLYEYSTFIGRVKQYTIQYGINQAVIKAIDECVNEGILEDFLTHRKEIVMNSILYEYNQKEVIEMLIQEAEEMKEEIREEALKEGLEAGRNIGLEEGRNKGLEEGHNKGLEEGLEEGLNKGLKEGRIIGRQEGIAIGEEGLLKNLIVKMIYKGMNSQEISDLLEEPIEKIQGIVNSISIE